VTARQTCRFAIRKRRPDMNKSTAACAAFALALTGCAGHKSYRSFDIAASNEVHISVKVIADQYIIVNQEPVYVVQGATNTLYWHLDPAGPYFFSEKPQHPGVRFTPPPPVPGNHNCKRDSTDSKTFICTYGHLTSNPKFRYALKVTKDDINFLESDPTIMNN
jgi:hypothetical protein